MVEEEDGLQVFDLATQVEEIPLIDSGKKEQGAGSEFRFSGFGFEHG